MAGQSASASTGSEATASDITVTHVTIPAGAAPSSFTLTITETNDPIAPTGFSAFGQLVNIDAQGVTLNSPAVVIFHFDASVVAGISLSRVRIFRDGVPVPSCNGSNDPCVLNAYVDPSDDMTIWVETTHFSNWLAATADAIVSGSVTYGNAVTGTNPRGVPNVSLSGFGLPSVSDITTASGTYSLTGFGSGSYTITPSKSGGVNSAITSNDAARIAQYLTGNSSFTSVQATVADVSGAGGISSFDAALIARYAAALGAPTGTSGSWIFNPVSNTHLSITSDITDDYQGYLMGDVSGNWGDPSPFRPAGIAESGKWKAESEDGGQMVNAITVAVQNLAAPVDKEIVVPVSAQGAAGKGIISYEFDLRYDPAVIQPLSKSVDVSRTVSRGLFVVVNPYEPGLLRVVVYGPMPINENGVLLNLRFTAVGKAGSISPLTFERIVFNEGEPRVIATEGLITLF